MSGQSQPREFDSNLQPRERRSGFPRLELRRRSAEHPMGMFAVLVTSAFMAMAFAPQSGTAFASIGTGSTLSEPAQRSGKGDRVLPSQSDMACRGQAWGAESQECLAMIARDAGFAETRKVRLIASADLDQSAPNVF